MNPELQVKLLRVLESGHFLRVGGNDPIEADVRIIAATNRDPGEACRDGELREDLYYRLNVFTINLPPLRERGEDIQLLAQHFLDELNARRGNAEALDAAGARARSRERPWRGNVRELRNAVHQAFILADREIGGAIRSRASSRCRRQRQGGADASAEDGKLQVSVGSEIAAVEKQLILATLDHFEGDKKKAAQTLGISLKTLYNRLSVYRAGGDRGTVGADGRRDGDAPRRGRAARARGIPRRAARAREGFLELDRADPPPETLIVDEIVRFEGESDPATRRCSSRCARATRACGHVRRDLRSAADPISAR